MHMEVCLVDTNMHVLSSLASVCACFLCVAAGEKAASKRKGTLATDGKTVHTHDNRRCIPRRGYARSPGIDLALIVSEHRFGADDEETLDAAMRAQTVDEEEADEEGGEGDSNEGEEED
jgi:hypothetical protein